MNKIGSPRKAMKVTSLFPMIPIAFLFAWQFYRLLRVTYSGKLKYITSPLPSKLITPTIYNNINISAIPQLISSGPTDALPNTIGMYQFENVCLTKHLTEYDLTGLVYFTPDDTTLLNNPKRCIPCSAPLNHDGGWNGTGRDEKEVNHKCGFETLHAMFASDVQDFAECYSKQSVQRQLEIWGQRYIPHSVVNTVHYYEEPMIHLGFSSNIAHALFDHLLTYLPYWYAFKTQNNWPFSGVTSVAHQGCLNNNNGGWYCETLRAMNAFGPNAMEVFPPSYSRSDHNTTLYCYKKVFINHLALQRTLTYDKQITKPMFDEFRDELFAKFGLKRGRSFHSNNDTNRGNNTKSKRILLYAHEPSGRRVWLGMNDLIADIRPKYNDVEFHVVKDFGAYTIAQQADLFNTYDAHIMVHGAQMANSIFAVDKSLFVELGCKIPTFISNQKFLHLIDGKHIKVEKCEDGRDDERCVVCDNTDDLTYGNFTVTSAGFQSLVDDVLLQLEQGERSVAT